MHKIVVTSAYALHWESVGQHSSFPVMLCAYKTGVCIFSITDDTLRPSWMYGGNQHTMDLVILAI